MEQTVLFPGVKDGDVFNVGGLEFIKFPDVDGKTPAVLKGIAFRSRFGKNGNFAESEVLKRLNKEILPVIVEAVGEENVCSFVTDLTTLDGMKTYGSAEGKISLPTVDFYRAHPEIFDRHIPGGWWWLATADSAAPRNPDWLWVCCVAPSGRIDRDHYVGDNYGVRPFCIFKSSIFGSSESWSPKNVFEEAYCPTDGMSFGLAIGAAKKGKKIARAGWNGKGMYVIYRTGYPDGIPCNKNTADAVGIPEGTLFKVRPYLQMKCVDDSFQMWLASQSDILTDDWYIVE